MATLSVLTGNRERNAPATIQALEAYDRLTGNHGANPKERQWVILRDTSGRVIRTAPLGRYVPKALVKAIFAGDEL